MNNDLISRSGLIKTIKSTDTTYNPHFAILLNSLVNLVNEQPTAYDFERVIEELNEESWEYMSDFGDTRVIELSEAIDIVKRGRIDD